MGTVGRWTLCTLGTIHGPQWAGAQWALSMDHSVHTPQWADPSIPSETRKPPPGVGGAFLHIKMSTVQCGDNCYDMKVMMFLMVHLMIYLMMYLMVIIIKEAALRRGWCLPQDQDVQCGHNFCDHMMVMMYLMVVFYYVFHDDFVPEV